MPRVVYVPELGRSFSFRDDASNQDISAYLETNFKLPPVTQESPPPAEDGPGAFGAGVYGGIAALQAAGGKAAQGIGLQDFSKYLFDASRENQAYADKYQPEVADISQIGGIGDLLSYAGSSAAQSAPETAIGIGGAYAGGAAGAAIGSVVPLVGTAAGGLIGGLIGGAMAGLPFFVGRNLQRQAEEQDKTLEETSGLAASAGAIAQAPLDAAFDVLIARKFPGGGAVLDEARRGFFREVASTAGRGAATEALTEPAQQAIELAQANPERLLEFGPEVQFELLNAAATGSLVGGVLGGGAASVEPVARKIADAPKRQLLRDLESEAVANQAIVGQGELVRAAEELRQYNVEGPVTIGEADIEGMTGFTIKAPSGNMFGAFSTPEQAQQAIEIYKQRTGAKITATVEETPEVDEEVGDTDQAPVPQATIRVYHSGSKGDGETGRWVSTNKKYASDYRRDLPLYYIDLPADDPRLKPDEFNPDQGVEQGFTFNFELTPEEAAQLQPIERDEPPEFTEEDFAPVAEPIPEEMPIGAIEMPVEEQRYIDAVEEAAAPEAAPTAEVAPEPPKMELRPSATDEQLTDLKAELFGTPKNIRDMTPEERTLYEAERDKRYPPVEVDVSYDAGMLKTPKTLTEVEQRPDARKYTPEYQTFMDRVYTELSNRLKNIAPDTVSLKLRDFVEGKANRLTRGGETPVQTPDGLKSIIELATGYVRPGVTVEEMVNELVGTLNHEVIHALRTQGLLRPAEWQMLSRAAAKTKVPGKKYTYLDKAQAVYEPMGGIYTTEDAVIEEAVAEMYKDWVAGKNRKEAVPVAGLFNRITEFFRRIFRTLQNRKYEDVFKQISAGEMRTREGVPNARGGERFSAAPVEERDAAFQRLADGQRYLPEYAMLDVQKAMGGGVISHAVEHLGDITHRMSEKFSYLEGQQGIVDQKVTSVLRALKNPYGFAREFEENIRANAAYNKTTPERVREAVWKALEIYANEHAKLEVFNEPQRLARDAAVALGRRNYTEATRLLERLKVYSGGDPDTYKTAVGKYDPPSPDGVRFSAAPALNSDEFKRWFKQSKAVNPDGKPKTVYHGTSKKFRAFDTRSSEIGSHFGTTEQANDFVITDPTRFASEEDAFAVGDRNDQIFPVYLSIQNPLRLVDYTGKWSPRAVAKQLVPLGIITKEEFEAISNLAPTRQTITRIQDAIKSAGYDGIVYLNRHEGFDYDPFDINRARREDTDQKFKEANPGANDSYIIFEPTQVKSIFNQFEEGAAEDTRFAAAPLPQNIAQANQTLFAPMPKEGFFNWMSEYFFGPPIGDKTLNTVYGPVKMTARKRKLLRGRAALVDTAAGMEELEKLRNLARGKGYQRDLGEDSTIAAMGMQRRSSHVGVSMLLRGRLDLDFARPGDIQSAMVKVNDDPDSMANIVKILMQPGPPDAVTGEPDDLRRTFASYGAAKRAQNLKLKGVKVPNQLSDSYINTIIPFVQQNYPEVVRAYEMYQRFNRNLLTTAKKAGLIDDILYQKLVRSMDYYGFYHEVYEVPQVPGTPTKTASKFELRPMKGSQFGNLVGDPVFMMVHNAQFWVNAITKNIAAQKAFKLGSEMNIVRLLRSTEKPDPSLGEEEEVLFFSENGRTKRFATTDPLVITALGSDDRTDVGMAMKLLGMPTQVVREMVTRDPAFTFANLGRDTVSVWVTSGADILPFISAVKGFASAYKKGASFQALMGRGVVGSYDLAMKDAKQVAAELRDRATPKNILTLDTPEAAKAVLGGLWNRLGALSEYSDAAMRIAVYEAAKAKGLSDAEATWQSIEILDFTRRGGNQLLSILTKLIPFLNARIQGLDVLYQAGKAGARVAVGAARGEREANLGKKFLVRGAILAAISIALEWANEDDEDYQQLDDYIKNSNLLIPLRIFGLEGQFLGIPKAFETGLLFSTFPQQFYKTVVSGDASARENANLFFASFASTFGVTPIPQFMLPTFEVLLNHDFYTGLPLISEGKMRLAPELQYNARTSQLAMMLGGIPIWYDTTSGKFEGISPIVIDNLISGYGGPLGTYMAEIVSLGMESAQVGPERLPKDISNAPIVRRFFIDAEVKNPKVVTQAYELFRVVDEANRSFSRLRQTGDAEAVMDYLEKNRDVLSYKKYVFKLVDRLNKLSAHERQIERDQTMTREEKLEAMAKLREVRIRLASKVKEINAVLGR